METNKRLSKRHQKLSDRKLKIMSSIDRLGALPDAVICHILSFIPTKISVRTSILARRWRFLWTHVPTLDFYDLEKCRIPIRSSDIVNRVMLMHKVQSLNTLRMAFHSLCYSREYELDTWITTAISRNLQNLDLCVDLDTKPTLPRCVFTCKTLVRLSLTGCAGIPSSGPIYLPSLKKLQLEEILCEVDEALPHLLSGCPVLEELTIQHIRIMDQHVGGCLNISSPTVKRLELTITWSWDIQMFIENDYMVKINAPALVYLKVYDCPFMNYSILPIKSLTEAHIDLDIFMLVEEVTTTCSVVKLLYPLCDVKCLKLTCYSRGENLQFPDPIVAGSVPKYVTLPLRLPDPIVAGSIPKFGNLTKLKLIMELNWHFVMRLLASADNLEVLTVCVGLTNWVEPEQVPTCLLSCVRTIRINDIECTEHGYSMVKYLLRIAQVLERMDIHFGINIDKCVDKKTQSDARKIISKFERGSMACKLVIH